MQNETSFPATRQDINNLKQTACDAAADLGSTATVHASRVKGQLNDLAGHAQEEGRGKWNEVKGSFAQVVSTGSDYVSANPLFCLGIAFGVGAFIGFAAKSGPKD